LFKTVVIRKRRVETAKDLPTASKDPAPIMHTIPVSLISRMVGESNWMSCHMVWSEYLYVIRDVYEMYGSVGEIGVPEIPDR
jgi:hypothetical protein